MDASDIHPPIINAKEVLTPQKREYFISQQMVQQIVRKRHELREPTQRREQLVRSEDLSGELQGEPEWFQHTESTDDAEAERLLVDPR